MQLASSSQLSISSRRGNKQIRNRASIAIQLASQLVNQMMPRLPGCLFKFIQKQPQDNRDDHSRQLASQLTGGVRKLKRCSQKFLTKFTRKTSESLFQILLKKKLWHLFSCEFSEISKNTFFTEHLLCCSLGDCCFFQSFFLSPSFHLFVASYSYRYLILREFV